MPPVRPKRRPSPSETAARAARREPAAGAAKVVFGNREQSWLAFNRRVLDQARNPGNPLLERVKFLAIVSSNLDEYFEIRVSGLMQQADSEGAELSLDGLAPREQLRRVHEAVNTLVADQYACWHRELVHVAKVALPLYPQFGTEPNGYYIPPRWVPKPYLEQMFGPGVEHAIHQYLAPGRELLAVLQLFRRDSRMIFRYDIEEGPLVYEGEIHGQPFQLHDDTVIAFGEKGEELFRTTVEEPLHIRPSERINWV